ncbi:hypothetical protein AcW1_004813 [Taiwanofungus camphoratus]|nr:hypothetical protein AcV5_001197 [Antrodia cinnamomea]KAI0960246.1 hypothetical protein AcW1_004813 [Antrodia cinnamomea]
MPGGVRRNVGGDNHGPPVQTTGGTKNGSGRNESSFVIPPSSALAQPPQVTHAVPSLNVNTKIASTAWGNPSSSAVDWNETGQDSGNPSVTWADPVQSLMGDPAPVPQAPTTASIQSGAWKHWRSEAQGSGKSQVAQPTDGKQYQRTFSQQQAATQQQEADRHQQQRRQWQQQQQHQLLGQALQQHRVQLQRQQQFAGSRTSKNQQQQFRRPQQIEQANSWGSSGWDNTGLSANWVEPIPEEEEEENDGYDHEEDEDYNEDADGSGYSDGHGYGHHVRTSPSVSYVTRTSPASAQTPHTQPFLPTMVSSTQLWLPDGPTSKTMAMASGRSTTTVFELAAPRNGMGEVRFTDSYGDALVPAQRALFSKKRPVKDRIYWSFNPDKDPRVASLIKWIHAASNGLAEIGLQKFLQTGNRGALISNADYRVNHSPSLPAQPAFDWITLGQLHTTLDRILQESVALYDPGLQVIIFVFLLSRTGNSMAVWRRKIMIPDSVRQMHQQEILAAKGRLEQDYPVYVEELPPKDEPRPPEPKKGRIRNVLSKRKWFKWLS